MDFKQIEAFVNVARYKSFSRAAEAVYLSQPTISAHIASLEQELNVVLFDRTNKEIKITSAGAVFLEYATNMLNIRNTAVSSLADFDARVAGRLCISSSTTPARSLVPQLISRFYSLYPNVKFDLKEDSTKGVITNILNGVSEVGIVGEIIDDSRLEYKEIALDSLVIVSNIPDLQDEITMDTLFAHSFIQREYGSATRSVFEKALRRMGSSPDKLKVFVEVSSLESVLQFVKNGSVLSVASEMACQDLINSGIIRKHTIKDMDMHRGIYMAVHSRRTLSPTAKAFYNNIINSL
jgi:DNA-binding transcriptional LysR family regulator